MGGALSSTGTDANSYSSNSTIPSASHKFDSPNSSTPNISISDSKAPEDQAPKHPSDVQLDTKIPEEEKNQEDGGQSENVLEGEEEEEEECGFCLFMKAGGCKEDFIAWQECVEESEKNKEDVVEKCAEITVALKKCMQAHPDHYGPILNAEKAAEEKVVKELEKQKASESSEQNATSENSDQEGPILRPEKAAEVEVVIELEKENASRSSDQNGTSANSGQHGNPSKNQDR